MQLSASTYLGFFRSDPMRIGLVLLQIASVAALFALLAWIVGLAARRTLQLPMQLGPDIARKHILPKWIIGAIALCLLMLLMDLVFQWRAHQFGINFAQDAGYLIGNVIAGTVVGLITGLISRRGLALAIKIDEAIRVGAFE